jgi:hypothetical protein
MARPAPRRPLRQRVPFRGRGVHYLTRLEERDHEPDGALKPWGYHPGISLFVAVVPGSEAPLADGEGP